MMEVVYVEKWLKFLFSCKVWAFCIKRRRLQLRICSRFSHRSPLMCGSTWRPHTWQSPFKCSCWQGTSSQRRKICPLHILYRNFSLWFCSWPQETLGFLNWLQTPVTLPRLVCSPWFTQFAANVSWPRRRLSFFHLFAKNYFHILTTLIRDIIGPFIDKISYLPEV